jgi:hypothetical protein
MLLIKSQGSYTPVLLCLIYTGIADKVSSAILKWALRKRVWA